MFSGMYIESVAVTLRCVFALQVCNVKPDRVRNKVTTRKLLRASLLSSDCRHTVAICKSQVTHTRNVKH